MKSLLPSILRVWPGRWDHPRLAAAIASSGGELAPSEAAGLMLECLARPRTLAEALAELIDAGEFGTADDILAGVVAPVTPAGSGSGLADATAPPMPTSVATGPAASPAAENQRPGGWGASDWQRLDSALTQARLRARDQVQRELDGLATRAAAVGVELPDEGDVLEAATSRRSRAGELLAERLRTVERVEAEVGRTIGGTLAGRLAEAAERGDADRYAPWAEIVRSCLRSGEFRVAREMVEAGPDDILDAGPRTVPPPPVAWPWPGRDVREVLRWFDHPNESPGGEFERFRRGTEDAAARRVRAAVGNLCESVDGPAVRDLGRAIAEAVGEDVTPPLEALGEGFLTRVLGVGDARLPRLGLPLAEGLALWAGRGDSAPPLLGEPVVWFRPILARPPRRAGDRHEVRGDVAVLTAADLLRVLAPDELLRPTGPATRRVNLLRAIVPQLEHRLVLGNSAGGLGAGASPRDSLAWLFDLFGMAPDGPVLDSLLRDSSGHPTALRHMAEAIVSTTAHGERITVDGLRAARADEVRESARGDLLVPLAADAAARVLLWLALWRFDPGERVPLGVIADSVSLLVPEPSTTASPATPDASRLELGRAARTLVDAGLFQDVHDGTVTLPAAGLYDLLRGDAGAAGAQAGAAAALEEFHERASLADRATAAALGGRVTELIAHSVDNDVLDVVAMLDELGANADPRLAAVKEKVLRDLGGDRYARAYQEALRPPEPVELADVIGAVIADFEWKVPDNIHLGTIPGTETAIVLANPYILREALGNLLTNAVRAAAAAASRDAGAATAVLPHGESGPGSGTVAVRLCLHTDAPLLRGIEVAAPCVTIEVADSGHGFSDEAMAKYGPLTAGGRPQPGDAASSGTTGAAAGRGFAGGLEQTDAWVRQYRGRLDILDRGGRCGGATVTMWLPLAGPTSHESG